MSRTPCIHATEPAQGPPLFSDHFCLVLAWPYDRQAWELSAKTQISAAVKLTFRGENNFWWGNEIGSTKEKEKASTSFSSARNTRETYGARSHAAIAHLGHVIMNTVTCCYSHRLATGLNAVILTHFCAMFWQKVKSISRLPATACVTLYV